jgi:hypothetical protein
MDEEGGQPDYPYVPLPTAVLYDERLDAGAVRLYVILFQVQATGGRPFEMKQAEMVELGGASAPTVKRWRDQLVDAGWLEETALRGFGLTNLYQVNTPGQQVGQVPAEASPPPTGPAGQ